MTLDLNFRRAAIVVVRDCADQFDTRDPCKSCYGVRWCLRSHKDVVICICDERCFLRILGCVVMDVNGAKFVFGLGQDCDVVIQTRLFNRFMDRRERGVEPAKSW
ncbi:hypothetical protein D3C81_2051390 [compost metagenome]